MSYFKNNLPCTDACHLIGCGKQLTFHQYTCDESDESDCDDKSEKLDV